MKNNAMSIKITLLLMFIFLSCFYNRSFDGNNEKKTTLIVNSINKDIFLDYIYFYMEDSLGQEYFLLAKKELLLDTFLLQSKGYERMEIKKKYNFVLRNFDTIPALKVTTRAQKPLTIIIERKNINKEDLILWASDTVTMKESLIYQNKVYTSDLIHDTFIKTK